MRTVKPYSVLAAGYDFVMAHVDYPGWALYIHDLIKRYDLLGNSPLQLLELGCGTAAFGFEFSELGGYSYRGLDASEDMVKIARHKADLWNCEMEVGVSDFLSFDEQETTDVVLLVYDGLNYLLREAEVGVAIENVFNSLKPGGLFLFDQSTPANSENNQEYFEDSGAHGEFSYRRLSSYDAETRMHSTHFEFTVGDQTFVEDHCQRAYNITEINDIVAASRFEKVACFEGFSTIEANDDAERVQWILRRPMQ